MKRSRHISFDDARTIFAIVGECRELWADPIGWQTHLLRRATRFTGCRVGLCYEIKDEPAERAAELVSAVDVGWLDASERCTLINGLACRRLSYSPLWKEFARRLSRKRPVTLCQRQLIDDDQWHASEMYDSYVRPTHVGQGIMSGVWMPHRGTWNVWCLTTDRSDRPLSEHQRQCVSLLHQQIAPLFGTKLCASNQRSLDGLTPLRRQILDQLLAGRTEQEIANAIHRSRATVHEHIARLYDHFAVNSRSKLCAYFIQREPTNHANARPFDRVKEWLKNRPHGQESNG